MDLSPDFEAFGDYAHAHLGMGLTYDERDRVCAVRRYENDRHVHIRYDYEERRVYVVRMDSSAPGAIAETDRRWLDGGPREWMRVLLEEP